MDWNLLKPPTKSETKFDWNLIEPPKEEEKLDWKTIKPPEPEFKLEKAPEVNKTFWEKVKSVFEEKPEVRIAKAQVSYNISQKTGIPILEVEKNLPKITKDLGIRGVPTSEEFLTAMFTFPVTAALISNPVTAGIGVAKFMALTEAENFVISKLKKWEYKFGAGVGLKELLPEEMSQLTKDLVDVADFIGKGIIIAKTDPKIMKMWEAFTKKISTEYTMPKNVYVSAGKVKSIFRTLPPHKLSVEELQLIKDLGMTGSQYRNAVKKGIDIEIPASKLTTITDRPYWAKLKGLFNVKPVSETVVTRGGKVAPAKLMIEGKVKVPEVAVKIPEVKLDPAIDALQRMGEAQSRLDPNKIIREADRLSGGNAMKAIQLKEELKMEAIKDRWNAQNDLYEALEPKYHIGDIVEVEWKGVIEKQKVKIESAVFKTGLSAQQMLQTGFPASFALDELRATNVVTGERVSIYSNNVLVNGEILSTTIKRKSEDILKQVVGDKTRTPIPEIKELPTPTTEKVAEVPLEGIGKVSKIGKDIESKAIEAGLTKGFGHLAEYTPIVIKEQAQRASDLINTNIDEARRIIRGEKFLPEGLKGTALITAMEEHIKNTASGELASELAVSPLVSGTSAAAQELRLAAEREPTSPVKAIEDINKELQKTAERKLPGKILGKAKADTVSRIKNNMKNANTRYSWTTFIESIRC